MHVDEYNIVRPLIKTISEATRYLLEWLKYLSELAIQEVEYQAYEKVFAEAARDPERFAIGEFTDSFTDPEKGQRFRDEFIRRCKEKGCNVRLPNASERAHADFPFFLYEIKDLEVIQEIINQMSLEVWEQAKSSVYSVTPEGFVNVNTGEKLTVYDQFGNSYVDGELCVGKFFPKTNEQLQAMLSENLRKELSQNGIIPEELTVEKLKDLCIKEFQDRFNDCKDKEWYRDPDGNMISQNNEREMIFNQEGKAIDPATGRIFISEPAHIFIQHRILEHKKYEFKHRGEVRQYKRVPGGYELISESKDSEFIIAHSTYGDYFNAEKAVKEGYVIPQGPLSSQQLKEFAKYVEFQNVEERLAGPGLSENVKKHLEEPTKDIPTKKGMSTLGTEFFEESKHTVDGTIEISTSDGNVYHIDWQNHSITGGEFGTLPVPIDDCRYDPSKNTLEILQEESKKETTTATVMTMDSKEVEIRGLNSNKEFYSSVLEKNIEKRLNQVLHMEQLAIKDSLPYTMTQYGNMRRGNMVTYLYDEYGCCIQEMNGHTTERGEFIYEQKHEEERIIGDDDVIENEEDEAINEDSYEENPKPTEENESAGQPVNDEIYDNSGAKRTSSTASRDIESTNADVTEETSSTSYDNSVYSETDSTTSVDSVSANIDVSEEVSSTTSVDNVPTNTDVTEEVSSTSYDNSVYSETSSTASVDNVPTNADVTEEVSSTSYDNNTYPETSSTTSVDNVPTNADVTEEVSSTSYDNSVYSETSSTASVESASANANVSEEVNSTSYDNSVYSETSSTASVESASANANVPEEVNSTSYDNSAYLETSSTAVRDSVSPNADVTEELSITSYNNSAYTETSNTTNENSNSIYSYSEANEIVREGTGQGTETLETAGTVSPEVTSANGSDTIKKADEEITKTENRLFKDDVEGFAIIDDNNPIYEESYYASSMVKDAQEYVATEEVENKSAELYKEAADQYEEAKFNVDQAESDLAAVTAQQEVIENQINEAHQYENVNNNATDADRASVAQDIEKSSGDIVNLASEASLERQEHFDNVVAQVENNAIEAEGKFTETVTKEREVVYSRTEDILNNSSAAINEDKEAVSDIAESLKDLSSASKQELLDKSDTLVIERAIAEDRVRDAEANAAVAKEILTKEYENSAIKASELAASNREVEAAQNTFNDAKAKLDEAKISVDNTANDLANAKAEDYTAKKNAYDEAQAVYDARMASIEKAGEVLKNTTAYNLATKENAANAEAKLKAAESTAEMANIEVNAANARVSVIDSASKQTEAVYNAKVAEKAGDGKAAEQWRQKAEFYGNNVASDKRTAEAAVASGQKNIDAVKALRKENISQGEAFKIRAESTSLKEETYNHSGNIEKFNANANSNNQKVIGVYGYKDDAYARSERQNKLNKDINTATERNNSWNQQLRKSEQNKTEASQLLRESAKKTSEFKANLKDKYGNEFDSSKGANAFLNKADNLNSKAEKNLNKLVKDQTLSGSFKALGNRTLVPGSGDPKQVFGMNSIGLQQLKKPNTEALAKSAYGAMVGLVRNAAMQDESFRAFQSGRLMYDSGRILTGAMAFSAQNQANISMFNEWIKSVDGQNAANSLSKLMQNSGYAAGADFNLANVKGVKDLNKMFGIGGIKPGEKSILDWAKNEGILNIRGIGLNLTKEGKLLLSGDRLMLAKFATKYNMSIKDLEAAMKSLNELIPGMRNAFSANALFKGSLKKIGFSVTRLMEKDDDLSIRGLSNAKHMVNTVKNSVDKARKVYQMYFQHTQSQAELLKLVRQGAENPFKNAFATEKSKWGTKTLERRAQRWQFNSKSRTYERLKRSTRYQKKIEKRVQKLQKLDKKFGRIRKVNNKINKIKQSAKNKVFNVAKGFGSKLKNSFVYKWLAKSKLGKAAKVVIQIAKKIGLKLAAALGPFATFISTLGAFVAGALLAYVVFAIKVICFTFLVATLIMTVGGAIEIVGTNDDGSIKTAADSYAEAADSLVGIIYNELRYLETEWGTSLKYYGTSLAPIDITAVTDNEDARDYESIDIDKDENKKEAVVKFTTELVSAQTYALSQAGANDMLGTWMMDTDRSVQTAFLFWKYETEIVYSGIKGPTPFEGADDSDYKILADVDAGNLTEIRGYPQPGYTSNSKAITAMSQVFFSCSMDEVQQRKDEGGWEGFVETVKSWWASFWTFWETEDDDGTGLVSNIKHVMGYIGAHSGWSRTSILRNYAFPLSSASHRENYYLASYIFPTKYTRSATFDLKYGDKDVSEDSGKSMIPSSLMVYDARGTGSLRYQKNQSSRRVNTATYGADINYVSNRLDENVDLGSIDDVLYSSAVLGTTKESGYGIIHSDGGMGKDAREDSDKGTMKTCGAITYTAMSVGAYKTGTYTTPLKDDNPDIVLTDDHEESDETTMDEEGVFNGYGCQVRYEFKYKYNGKFATTADGTKAFDVNSDEYMANKLYCGSTDVSEDVSPWCVDDDQERQYRNDDNDTVGCGGDACCVLHIQVMHDPAIRCWYVDKDQHSIEDSDKYDYDTAKETYDSLPTSGDGTFESSILLDAFEMQATDWDEVGAETCYGIDYVDSKVSEVTETEDGCIVKVVYLLTADKKYFIRTRTEELIHDCHGDHAGYYCGGHLQLKTRGIVYGFSEDQMYFDLLDEDEEYKFVPKFVDPDSEEDKTTEWRKEYYVYDFKDGDVIGIEDAVEEIVGETLESEMQTEIYGEIEEFDIEDPPFENIEDLDEEDKPDDSANARAVLTNDASHYIPRARDIFDIDILISRTKADYPDYSEDEQEIATWRSWTSGNMKQAIEMASTDWTDEYSLPDTFNIVGGIYTSDIYVGSHVDDADDNMANEIFREIICAAIANDPEHIDGKKFSSAKGQSIAEIIQLTYDPEAYELLMSQPMHIDLASLDEWTDEELELADVIMHLNYAFDCVGKVGYSQEFHMHLYDNLAGKVTDCSGFVSNIWRDRLSNTIYTTESFVSDLGSYKKPYTSEAITSGAIQPGDIIIDSGNGHALLYVGYVNLDMVYSGIVEENSIPEEGCSYEELGADTVFTIDCSTMELESDDLASLSYTSKTNVDSKDTFWNKSDPSNGSAFKDSGDVEEDVTIDTSDIEVSSGNVRFSARSNLQPDLPNYDEIYYIDMSELYVGNTEETGGFTVFTGNYYDNNGGTEGDNSYVYWEFKSDRTRLEKIRDILYLEEDDKYGMKYDKSSKKKMEAGKWYNGEYKDE